MNEGLKSQLTDWADTYNDPVYFQEDPIAFPREFLRRGASLQDVEIAAVFAAHFAWGRRAMIVRDCTRLFDEMQWRPYDYILARDYRSDPTSIHRTVKWSEVAQICDRLYSFYTDDSPLPPSSVDNKASSDARSGRVFCESKIWKGGKTEGARGMVSPVLMVPGVAQVPGAEGSSSGSSKSIETLTVEQIRVKIYGQKEDANAANKKINMMRRWMVRKDGKVDLGLWSATDPKDLVIPLDVHVYTQAEALGLTKRRQKDIVTAKEITDQFREIWPEDPVKGDFALFGYGVTRK